MSKRARFVKFIAIWMLIVAYPGVAKFIEHYPIYDFYSIPMTLMLEWGCNLLFIICAIGLMFSREWARSFVVKGFYVFFLWCLYVVYSQIGPSFASTVEFLTVKYKMTENVAKGTLISLMVIYLLWPIIGILFLTHPKIKRQFAPGYSPEDEEDPV